MLRILPPNTSPIDLESNQAKSFIVEQCKAWGDTLTERTLAIAQLNELPCSGRAKSTSPEGLAHNWGHRIIQAICPSEDAGLFELEEALACIWASAYTASSFGKRQSTSQISTLLRIFSSMCLHVEGDECFSNTVFKLWWVSYFALKPSEYSVEGFMKKTVAFSWTDPLVRSAVCSSWEMAPRPEISADEVRPLMRQMFFYNHITLSNWESPRELSSKCRMGLEEGSLERKAHLWMHGFVQKVNSLNNRGDQLLLNEALAIVGSLAFKKIYLLDEGSKIGVYDFSMSPEKAGVPPCLQRMLHAFYILEELAGIQAAFSVWTRAFCAMEKKTVAEFIERTEEEATIQEDPELLDSVGISWCMSGLKPVGDSPRKT